MIIQTTAPRHQQILIFFVFTAHFILAALLKFSKVHGLIHNSVVYDCN